MFFTEFKGLVALETPEKLKIAKYLAMLARRGKRGGKEEAEPEETEE
jgi:hypothetical protein